MNFTFILFFIRLLLSRMLASKGPLLSLELLQDLKGVKLRFVSSQVSLFLPEGGMLA